MPLKSGWRTREVPRFIASVGYEPKVRGGGQHGHFRLVAGRLRSDAARPAPVALQSGPSVGGRAMILGIFPERGSHRCLWGCRPPALVSEPTLQAELFEV